MRFLPRFLVVIRRHPAVESDQMRHPFLFALLILLASLAILQRHFILQPEVWAEGYAEYLSNAYIWPEWSRIFHPGWFSYWAVLPTFFVKLYVAADWPVSWVGHYYRAIVMTLTVLSCAFIAHSSNRSLIKSDYLRIGLALGLLSSLNHVSQLTFINIWYIGAVVIALVSLNPKPLAPHGLWLYGLFALSVSLTKPSLVILPFVFYRLLKQRSWPERALNLLILSAASFEIWLALSGDTAIPAASSSLLVQVSDVVLGSAIMLLKIFHAYPVNLLIVLLAGVLLAVAFYAIWRQHGLAVLTLLVTSLGLAVYSYVQAPDSRLRDVSSQFQTLYLDNFKLQREILIIFLLLVIVFIAIDFLLRRTTQLKAKGLWTLTIVTVILFGGRFFRPIDTEGVSVEANIQPFLTSLNSGTSACVPIPPNPTWGEGVNWYFQYRGGCMSENFDRPLALGGKTLSAEGLRLSLPGYDNKELKTIMVLIHNPQTHLPAQLALTDLSTGRQFRAEVRAKKVEQYSFLAFNLHDLGPRPQHEFRLSVTRGHGFSSDLGVELFEGSDEPVHYTYWIGYPNLQGLPRPE
jgi:hypothetical protein